MSGIALASDVFFVPAPDGSARLLNLNGSFYALDRVGAAMLQSALEVGQAGAAERLAQLFEVPDERARTDLEDFLEHLERERLVHIASEGVPVPAKPSYETLLIPPALAFLRQRFLSDSIRIWLLLLLARTSFALFGWSRTVTVWRCDHGRPAFVPCDICRIGDDVRRVSARHWFVTECKERALCCWTLLRWSEVSSSLAVGVSLYPLRGHCWCMCGDETLADDPERTSMFTVIKTYT
jgi:hypothetical protein